MYQVIVLVILSISVSVLVNALRPEGLIWMQVTQPPGTFDIESITPDEAWVLLSDNRIRFVDARSALDFYQGHLPGAVNVPHKDMEKAFMQLKSIVQSGSTLVTYCDDPECTLGLELARLLKNSGIDTVKVLTAGWAGWYEAGYPVEESMEGGAG